ncbi:MAG: hypothetical protein QOG37_2831 [Mycobacterium sp.]|nr:hypothetical protein [Mycobacterium sp.]
MDQRVRAEAGDEGAEAFSAGDIWYDDHDRTEPVDWFSRRGWYTRSVAAADYLAQLGRPLAPDEEPFAALANSSSPSGLVQTPGTHTQMPLRSSQMPVRSTSGSEAVLIDASRRRCFMTVAGRTAHAVGAPRRLQTKLPLILY